MENIVMNNYLMFRLYNLLHLKLLKVPDEQTADDIMICEKVQKGLESKGYDKGRFSPQE